MCDYNTVRIENCLNYRNSLVYILYRFSSHSTFTESSFRSRENHGIEVVERQIKRLTFFIYVCEDQRINFKNNTIFYSGFV